MNSFEFEKVITFDEAIADSSRYAKRHLLLGNGFSIACRPSIFTYGSLLAQAKKAGAFAAMPEVEAVFGKLKTLDFEVVIRMLEDMGKILPVYGKKGFPKTSAKMADHASALKDILIKTVSDNHPAKPNEIDDIQFYACRRFLKHFIGDGNDGKIYTLNYDLLLYWVLMHDDHPFGDTLNLRVNDGFGREDDGELEFVTWLGEGGNNHQRIHYMHGALHLFDAGAALKKYTWVNVGVPLLEQAREAMNKGMFPLFVAEGSSPQKLAKIQHSAYLHHSFKSFAVQMTQKDQCLFIYGHSLAENDLHILNKIARGRVRHLYVSLYGDPKAGANPDVIAAAHGLMESRPALAPLGVTFFSAATAKVWEW